MQSKRAHRPAKAGINSRSNEKERNKVKESKPETENKTDSEKRNLKSRQKSILKPGTADEALELAIVSEVID